MFIEIQGIKKHYGEGDSRVEVLRGIDISINQGEFCVLLGPSGSGKSTLLNTIGGIDQADEGSITIQNEKTADMNEKKLTQYFTKLWRAWKSGSVGKMRAFRQYPRI